MSEKKVLEMKGITKIYPGVRALDGVDFIVEEGSVHTMRRMIAEKDKQYMIERIEISICFIFYIF